MNGVGIGLLQEALHAMDGCLDIVVGREVRRSPRKPSNVPTMVCIWSGMPVKRVNARPSAFLRHLEPVDSAF